MIAALLTLTALSSTPNGWATLAELDLTTIRDTLAANHPGPVDRANPAFRVWLDEGYERAIEHARRADRFSDYRRTLLFYTNGFRDGHIGMSFRVAPATTYGPGFDVRPADGGAVVTRTETADVAVGDLLTSCDGRPFDALMADRVEPYYWNADIPHERALHMAQAFSFAADERDRAYTECSFRTGSGADRTLRIDWRPERPVDRTPAKPGLRRAEGLWILRLPSFNFQTDTQVADIEATLDDLARNRDSVRAGPLLIDLRGNGGGNSAWGKRIADRIWGEALVDTIVSGFDWTVDWRASSSNADALQAHAERSRQTLSENADGYQTLADRVRAAATRGEDYVRWGGMAGDPQATLPANPARQVFVLTDNACASACLDFMDAVRRIPRVMHIGLPTSGDAIYIDNTVSALPSNVARLSYSMKVYRNRVRGNNEWYTPQFLWRGGPMTDASVVAWARTLVAGQR